jgi:hypothetical protein
LKKKTKRLWQTRIILFNNSAKFSGPEESLRTFWFIRCRALSAMPFLLVLGGVFFGLIRKDREDNRSLIRGLPEMVIILF